VSVAHTCSLSIITIILSFLTLLFHFDFYVVYVCEFLYIFGFVCVQQLFLVVSS
jgi:hypothetical protein